MSMIDELSEVVRKIEELKPKDYVDVILSTNLPLPNGMGFRVEYEGKWYWILHQRDVRDVEVQCKRIQSTREPSTIGYEAMPMFGIPVVENEELVKEIMMYMAEQTLKPKMVDNTPLFNMDDVTKFKMRKY